MRNKHKALVIALLILVISLSVGGLLVYRNAGVSVILLPPQGFVLIGARDLPLREVRFPNFLLAQRYATATIQPLLKVGDVIEIDLGSYNVKPIYANVILVDGKGLWFKGKKTQIHQQTEFQSNFNIYLDVIPPWGTKAKIKLKITEVIRAEAIHEKISNAILAEEFPYGIAGEVEGFYVKEVYSAVWSE